MDNLRNNMFTIQQGKMECNENLRTAGKTTCYATIFEQHKIFTKFYYYEGSKLMFNDMKTSDLSDTLSHGSNIALTFLH